MAKNNKEKPDLTALDAESIIHSFRTTDHLQMAKDKGKDIPPVQEPEDPDVQEEEAVTIPVKETESPKEETRRKRTKAQDYESLFIREAAGITAREGKTVYIRKEYHDRILKIVRVIGGNELSLFSYLDNVLEHHFAMFQEDITTLYNKKNEAIF